jgi:MoaA/NifB/PqqE/SkfB family radical SAM enzyme
MHGFLDLFKRYFFRGKLDSIILFEAKDLSLQEMEKISQSAGKFRALLLSGGEPFMRKDLHQILLFFSRQNSISQIYIPTNGWYVDRTVEACTAFLQEEKRVTLTVSFSIDAMPEIHNRTRGVADCFEKACETINRLSALRADYPNLRLRVNSVVTPENVSDTRQVIDHFYTNYNLDEHDLEIVRGGDYQHPDFTDPREVVEAYRDCVHYAFDVYAGRAPQNRPAFQALPGFLGRSISYAFSRATADIKKDRVFGSNWPYHCTAGRNIAVIRDSGALAACELRDNIVQLGDYNFNFKAAFQSDKMKQERKLLLQDKCHCTHGCFVGNSLQYSVYGTLTRMLPHFIRYFFKSQKQIPGPG